MHWCNIKMAHYDNGDYLLECQGLYMTRVSCLQNITDMNILNQPLSSTPITFLGFHQLPSVGTILMAVNDASHVQEIIKMTKKASVFQEKLTYVAQQN